MSLCGRTSVFPLAYGFPHGKHVLNFTRDSKLLSKELWSLLIISMASQFRLSIFPSLVTPPCKILSVSLLKG